jgi:hypothetical protein
LLWFLFVLIGLGVLAYFIWDSRRKLAAREAASQRRFEEMLRAQMAAGPHAAAAPASAPGAAAAVAAAPPGAAAPAVSAPAAIVSARDRFLGQAATLLYYLLKTGLPDHEVFASVSLASVVASPAGDSQREQQARRLASYQLDFVVCDKSMRIVAAIEFDSAGGAEAAGIQQFKADCLKQAGIRLIRVNPASPPRREQVRALLYGGASPPAAGGAAT